MNVTLEQLKRLKACSEAIEWFQDKFPSGAKLDEAWAACPDNAWRVWYACQVLDNEAKQRLAWQFAGQAFRFAAQRHPSLQRWADNVNYRNVDEARAAAYAAAYDAYDAAAAAAAAYDAYDAAAAAYDAAAAAAAYDAAARDEQARWCAEALGLINYT